jgi:hypothetical protein
MAAIELKAAAFDAGDGVETRHNRTLHGLKGP